MGTTTSPLSWIISTVGRAPSYPVGRVWLGHRHLGAYFCIHTEAASRGGGGLSALGFTFINPEKVFKLTPFRVHTPCLTLAHAKAPKKRQLHVSQMILRGYHLPISPEIRDTKLEIIGWKVSKPPHG